MERIKAVSRFLYDGKRILDDVTPGQLEMESGDYIEVFRCRLRLVVLVPVVLVPVVLALVVLVLVVLVPVLVLVLRLVLILVESISTGRWVGSWRCGIRETRGWR